MRLVQAKSQENQIPDYIYRRRTPFLATSARTGFIASTQSLLVSMLLMCVGFLPTTRISLFPRLYLYLGDGGGRRRAPRCMEMKATAVTTTTTTTTTAALATVWRGLGPKHLAASSGPRQGRGGETQHNEIRKLTETRGFITPLNCFPPPPLWPPSGAALGPNTWRPAAARARGGGGNATQ